MNIFAIITGICLVVVIVLYFTTNVDKIINTTTKKDTYEFNYIEEFPLDKKFNLRFNGYDTNSNNERYCVLDNLGIVECKEIPDEDMNEDMNEDLDEDLDQLDQNQLDEIKAYNTEITDDKNIQVDDGFYTRAVPNSKYVHMYAPTDEPCYVSDRDTDINLSKTGVKYSGGKLRCSHNHKPDLFRLNYRPMIQEGRKMGGQYVLFNYDPINNNEVPCTQENGKAVCIMGRTGDTKDNRMLFVGDPQKDLIGDIEIQMDEGTSVEIPTNETFSLSADGNYCIPTSKNKSKIDCGFPQNNQLDMFYMIEPIEPEYSLTYNPGSLEFYMSFQEIQHDGTHTALPCRVTPYEEINDMGYTIYKGNKVECKDNNEPSVFNANKIGDKMYLGYQGNTCKYVNNAQTEHKGLYCMKDIDNKIIPNPNTLHKLVNIGDGLDVTVIREPTADTPGYTPGDANADTSGDADTPGDANADTPGDANADTSGDADTPGDANAS
uniref:Uncharacterized protein n=1 Tax=Megaviridae environmental sample TaxID=1737588 RepID=A0A5J6VIL6_9VIRU|nr:MAG: hypothetical protein [Megaviridae environmental sample]